MSLPSSAENGACAFEVDELIWIPETITRSVWGKGLMVEMRHGDLIAIGDLTVSHPGRKLTGFGVNDGWSYRAEPDGHWSRVPAPDDCPCGHEWRHRRHLSSLAIIEHQLDGSATGTAALPLFEADGVTHSVKRAF